MLYIIIPALPVLVWLWLGITFTILDYVLHVLEIDMAELARIIRYTSLKNGDMPGLLSFFDPDRNIQTIDPEEAEKLPLFMRNGLEMSTEPFTRVKGLGYKPYYSR